MDKPRETECDTDESKVTEPRSDRERATGTSPDQSGYYYDDTTGYKTYDPAIDNDDDED